MDGTSRWPKVPPALTPEQERAREAFVLAWHEVLPQRYDFVERFNHSSVTSLPDVPARFRTLEVGAGIGGHLPFEDLARQDYVCLEYRTEFCQRLRELPGIAGVVEASIENRTPLEDGSFDRVVAIHVLEHLRNLPAALDEISRVLAPGGIFDVVLPCEGGAAYWLARRMSAQPMFERRFRLPYKDIIANEHVNTIYEILPLLEARFSLMWKSFFPLPVPSYFANLCVAQRFVKR